MFHYFFITAIILALVPSVLLAQTGVEGYNLQLFSSPVDSLGGYHSPSHKILKDKNYSLGIKESFAGRAVTMSNPALGKDVSLVKYVATSEMSGAFGLWDRISFGINIPLLLTSGNNNLTTNSYVSFGIGDMIISPKINIVKEGAALPAITFDALVGLPTGKRLSFRGNGGITLEPRLIIGKDFSVLSATAHAGFRFLEKLHIQNTIVDDMMTYGGNIKGKLPHGFEAFAEIIGGRMISAQGRGFNPLETNAGIKQNFGKGWQWMFGGGGSLAFAHSGLGSYRLVTGLNYTGVIGGRRTDPAESVPEDEPLPLMQIGFSFDSVLISKNKREGLFELAQWLVADRQRKIFVDGYTDDIGLANYNICLSMRRAKAVAKLLKKLGVDVEQLSIRWFGEEAPKVPNTSPENRSANRRVEFSKVN